MKIILKHWGITTPASNVIHITPTTLRVMNDDKVDYNFYKADAKIEVQTKEGYTDINIESFELIRLR